MWTYFKQRTKIKNLQYELNEQKIINKLLNKKLNELEQINKTFQNRINNLRERITASETGYQFGIKI